MKFQKSINVHHCDLDNMGRFNISYPAKQTYFHEILHSVTNVRISTTSIGMVSNNIFYYIARHKTTKILSYPTT